MPRFRQFRLAAAALVWAATALPSTAATLLPDFSAATFLPGTPITNRYFPVTQGKTAVLTAQSAADGQVTEERSEHTGLGAGPTILGVGTTTVLDRAFANGLLMEETYDYYAQDSLGNVWYFGEDVTNYIYDEAGNLIGTNNSSAWRAGVMNALPGFIMPTDPVVGLSYYQEFAAENGALDQAVIHALGQTLMVNGQLYKDVLVTFETTALDPDARELKYYAPGVGLIRVEEDVDENFSNPSLTFNLVSPAPVPLPAGAGLLIGGLALLPLLRLAARRPRHDPPPRRRGGGMDGFLPR